MSSLKPIVLYSHATGPNPWKVAIILEELQIPYETKFLEFPEMKQEPYESINPNGRVPAIEDPNTGIKLFESGAIIQYLIDQYDPTNLLHSPTAPAKYLEQSWLHFQTSGQGPYYGQKAWFTYFHPERDLASAIDRYANEIRRVVGVIDRHLRKQGTAYLVGDAAPSYADLAFVPWHMALGFLVPGWDYAKDFPVFAAWNARLMERPAVRKVAEDKARAAAAAQAKR
ncbi:glutathione s-transferase [Diplodia corticola]|uniref:Glutathione s-transferase n=1 Tax=Diplodia corticola TaxID=236234 RepID=A0A1J9RRJ9_9PEZI|nr:glutathione s-transferase [Diplodia corticola]OJD30524.1 glutathione s-transferase [Diplodia corticola]